jgi:hypothetical protein
VILLNKGTIHTNDTISPARHAYIKYNGFGNGRFNELQESSIITINGT